MSAARNACLGAALIALVVLAQSMAYRDEVGGAAMAAEFTPPHGEADCRAPRPGKEFRVSLEWCDSDRCYRSCSIEPRNEKNSRARIKKRALVSS